MPVKEASSEETPYGRYVTSDGWFVLNLADALAVRNDQKGGAVYPLESRESPFGDFGVNVRVLWPGQPNALYHAETGQEGFLVLAGDLGEHRFQQPCHIGHRRLRHRQQLAVLQCSQQVRLHLVEQAAARQRIHP
mgnify:CR=1 FL=1